MSMIIVLIALCNCCVLELSWWGGRRGWRRGGRRRRSITSGQFNSLPTFLSLSQLFPSLF